MRTKWRATVALAIPAALWAGTAWADVAPEPSAAPDYGLPLILLATALEAVLLRLGFRMAWWKAAAAALLGSLLSYGALMLVGLTAAPPSGPQPPFLQSVFIAYPILVFAEAPVVFAFAGRQGWRWGVVALLVGNLLSAAALTVSRPPPTPRYERPERPVSDQITVPEPTAPRA